MAKAGGEDLLEKEAKNFGPLIKWVGAAAAFGGVLFAVDPVKGEEFFAGYLLEQSLSVDNLFVFVLVFKYFQVPVERQKIVLDYGIIGAAVFRAIMILLGWEIIETFEPALLVFAVILLFSSYKLLAGEDEDEEEDLEDNAIVKFCRKFMTVSNDYDGDNFWTMQNGVKMATPLLLVLAVIELSDVVFAVDSIPAVFGVTRDPLVIYSSNIFAILALRSLFRFVADAVAELEYLQTAVAVVLGFIGAKMIADFGGIHCPTSVSLLVVAGVLGTGVGASVLLPSDGDEAKEG